VGFGWENLEDMNEVEKATRSSAGTNLLVDRLLYDYIVDCWIYFDNNDNNN
jgi:hypothetical protein